MVNPAIDPTLGITPFQPFVFDDRPQNQWRLLPAPPRTKGGDVPNYQDHELIIFDLGGGLNKVRGRIFPHYLGVDLGDSNKTSSANGIDVSYPEQAILSTFMNTEAVWGQSTPYSSLYIYNTLFIGSGSVANKALYKENAVTGGLAAVTLSPADVIVSLTALQFDSAAPKMVVGIKNAQAFTLASDLTTTVGMNSTATLWGGIVSPLGATSGTNLIYNSTGASSNDAAIATIPISSAASTVSTDTGTRLNSGGYAVGIANVAVTPGNLVPRAVWVVPRNPCPNGMFSATGVFATSAEPADIIHTNLYGTDPQYLLTNLPFVMNCIVHEAVLYYTDGFNIMKNDGTETDLGWVYQREPDSNSRYFASGLGFARGQLIVAVSHINFNTISSSRMWLEKLDSSDKTRPRWFMISKQMPPGLTTQITDAGPGHISGIIMAQPRGELGYSLTSQCMYLLPGASNGFELDYYQFIPPPGYSHFWNYRFTLGAGIGGQKMEASGTYDSPELAFPFPLKGLPTVIIGMGIFGDLYAGGTGGSSVLSTVKLEQFTQGIGGKLTYSSTSRVSHTVGYRDGLRYEQRWKKFIDEDGNINAPVDPFNLFKYRMTITQDDSRTDWTPNALPIVFHFRTYVNGRVD